PSANTRTWRSARWTPTTWSARRASRSSPRTRRCSARRAPSANTRTWRSARWTPTTWSARRASRSSPRTRR
ncbi:hypothetical protein CTI14_71500, partial [Methylobacterium radiotolerans]